MDVPLCVVICATVWPSCAETADSVWKQKAAVQAVHASAGLVFYDYQLAGPGIVIPDPPTPAPPWLMNMIGVDFLAIPIEVSLGNGGIREAGELTQLRRLNVSCPVKDTDLVHIEALSKLEWLDLGGCPIGDDGLKHLDGLTQLRYLGIWSTNVSDAGLQHLKTLPQLRRLNLSDTKVTDAGLESLSELKQLEWLDVKQTTVTGRGVDMLQRALPNCRIER